MVEGEPSFWRAEFETNDPSAPDFVEHLEDIGVAVSVFEAKADDQQRTIAWRVEVLFDEEPDKPTIAKLISERLGLTTDLIVAAVSEQDWLGALERGRESLRIGRFLLHAGTETIVESRQSLAIELEAGMAFGTGEHQTTSGCLWAFDRLLRRYQFNNVLDMGCGTAVLAMAAAKAGAKRALAVDIDPIAVRVAAQNVGGNKLSRAVRVVQADGVSHPLVQSSSPYDLIFANILAEPLIDLAFGLRRRLAPGGYIILAGLLDYQANDVLQAYKRCGLRLEHQDSIDSWAILVLKRPGRRRK